MESQMDGMAVCEPISTNESVASMDSTQSSGNIKTAYPRFMTPIDPVHQVSPQSSNLIRRPSVDRSKQRPETPTRSLPVSSSRLRQKTWTSVASKGVDTIRSSAKSTNYSKRTPYRNGQSSGTGSYRLISVTQTEQQSTPCPDRSGGECNHNTRIESVADRAIPSEKSLPCPPKFSQDANMTPNIASPTIVNTKEEVLRHSPPQAPCEGDEWPVILPEKSEDGDYNANSENNQNDEAQLNRIDEEDPCTPIPDGVRLFADAISKLTKATDSYKTSGQLHVEEDDSGLDKNGAPISGSTKWNTAAPDQPSTNLSSPASRRPPLKIVTDFSKISKPAERSFDCHGPGTSPGYPSRAPKSNPFRDRPRVASSPSGANSFLIRENRASSYSFRSSPPSVRTTGAVTPKERSTGTPTPSNPFYTVSLDTTPRMDRSGSRIPRMSPRTLFPKPESDLGCGNETKASLFSPSKRSSIPLPTRLLQQNKEEDVTGNLLEATTPSAIFDRVEKTAAEKVITEQDSPNVSKEDAVSATNICHKSQDDLQEEASGMRENTDPFSDEVTVKQLSKSAPSHGPQLRISPEAKRLIMGENDNKLLERSTKENRGPSRKSGSKKEFRLSTDSLFATFSSKRSKNSSYRLSFSGKPPMGENNPAPAAGVTGKSISKSKSADFGLRRVSSGHRPMRRKSSPEKEPSCSVSKKVEADPFLDTECKDSDFKQPTQTYCEPVTQSGQPNEESCSSPVVEHTKKSSLPVSVGENTLSPSKLPGSVERARKAHNDTLKMNSPKKPPAYQQN